jgi:transposase
MKHITIICLAALALVFSSVAVAANGGGNHGSGQGNGGASQLQGISKQLKDRVAECKKAPPAARKECVEKLIAFLEDVKEKINRIEETIKDRCSGSPTAGSTNNGAPVADRCAKAEKLVDRLEKLKARIDQLEDKLRQSLGSSTNAGGTQGP